MIIIIFSFLLPFVLCIEDSQANTIKAFLVPCLALVIGIFLICLCWKVCPLYRFCIQHCFKELNRGSRRIISLQSTRCQMKYVDTQQKQGKFVTIQKGKQVIFTQTDEVCPICLDTNINLVLPCKHSGHMECMISWFSVKQSCPECRNDKLGNFKVCCEICKKKGGFLDKLIKKGKYICYLCEGEKIMVNDNII